MGCIRVFAVPLALAASAVAVSPAHAVVGAAPTAGVAALSLKATIASVPAGAGLATYGLSKDSDKGFWAGVGIAAGGLLIGFVDPPPATFYSGAFTFHYDGSLMEVRDTGWLGDWGQNAALPPPPVDQSLWEGVQVTLQAPNPSLSAVVSNDPVAGLQTVSFDWGPAGHATDATGPFNFYSTAFTLKKPVVMEFLGNFAQAPAGANFYVSSTGVGCKLSPDDTVPRNCGESTTHYYRVTEVPEPSTLALSLLGMGCIAVRLGRQRGGGGPGTGA